MNVMTDAARNTDLVPVDELRRIEATLDGWFIRRAQPVHRTNTRDWSEATRLTILDVELWFPHPDGSITKIHLQADSLDNLRDAGPMLNWALAAGPGLRLDMSRDAADRFERGYLERRRSGQPRLGG